MITGLYVELLYRAYDVPVLVMERRAHVGDPLNGLCHPALPVIGARRPRARRPLAKRSGQRRPCSTTMPTHRAPAGTESGRPGGHALRRTATIAAAGDGSVVPTGRKTPAHMARRYRPTGPQGHRPRGVGAAAPGQIEPLCACVGSCDLPGPRPGAAAQPRLSRDTGNRAPPGPTWTCSADVHRPWQAQALLAVPRPVTAPPADPTP